MNAIFLQLTKELISAPLCPQLLTKRLLKLDTEVEPSSWLCAFCLHLELTCALRDVIISGQLKVRLLKPGIRICPYVHLERVFRSQLPQLYVHHFSLQRLKTMLFLT